jgi:7-cyano-7-deazaguanine synthase
MNDGRQEPRRPEVAASPRHAVVVASGGIDSTTLAYWLAAQGAALTLISYDYGQRHSVELDFAAAVARALRAPHHVVDLSDLGSVLTGSALTEEAVGVPDGHYTAASMRATVVPNRNAIMLDVAVGAAIAAGADAVAYGAHAGDHAIYPDCRAEFLDAYARMAAVGNAGFLPDGFQVLAPLMAMSKADIVAVADELAVPLADTWSCYRGGRRHCGTCGTCVERREAFVLAGVPDPTRYARMEEG